MFFGLVIRVLACLMLVVIRVFKAIVCFSGATAGTYSGVDSNHKALAYALANLHGAPASFLLSDLGKIALPDESYEIVLSKDVIEHVFSYEEIISELARICSRTLILSMFIKMHEGENHIHRTREGFYLNAYNRQGLFDFAASCGLVEPQTIFENDQDEVIVFQKR